MSFKIPLFFVVPLGIYEQFGTIISQFTVMVPTSVAQTSSFDLVDDRGGECYNIRKKAQSAKTVASEFYDKTVFTSPVSHILGEVFISADIWNQRSR